MLQKHENIFEIKEEFAKDEEKFKKFADDAITLFSRNLLNKVINDNKILKIYTIKYGKEIRELMIDKSGKVIGLAGVEIKVGEKIEVKDKIKKEVLVVYAKIDILERTFKDKKGMSRRESFINKG